MAPVANFSMDWMKDDSPSVTLDCLLPTGVIVQLKVEKEATIEDIKEVIFYCAIFEITFTGLDNKYY